MQKNYVFIYNLNNRVYIRTDSIYLSELQNIFESREAAEEEIVQTNTCKNPFHDKDVYSVSLYSFFFLSSRVTLTTCVRDGTTMMNPLR